MPANSYVHHTPGDMVHMDIKTLGRIPDGGGWRKHGRGNDKTKGHAGVGYAYLHHVVDDCSRLAYSEILGDEKKDTVTGFWNRARDFFTGYGIDISRVMTDNGPAYRSRLFNDVLAPSRSNTSSRDRIGRSPTARSSGSTGRWSLNGPMPISTTAKPPVRGSIRGGCITAITIDPIAHRAA